jgi:hypothetical protein
MAEQYDGLSAEQIRKVMFFMDFGPKKEKALSMIKEAVFSNGTNGRSDGQLQILFDTFSANLMQELDDLVARGETPDPVEMVKEMLGKSGYKVE